MPINIQPAATFLHYSNSFSWFSHFSQWNYYPNDNVAPLKIKSKKVKKFKSGGSNIKLDDNLLWNNQEQQATLQPHSWILGSSTWIRTRNLVPLCL